MLKTADFILPVFVFFATLIRHLFQFQHVNEVMSINNRTNLLTRITRRYNSVVSLQWQCYHDYVGGGQRTSVEVAYWLKCLSIGTRSS